MSPWQGESPPGPRPSLRELILGALAGTAIGLRECAGFCADCQPRRPCPDHAGDLALASAYEAAYMRLRGIGSDGAMLALTGGLT